MAYDAKFVKKGNTKIGDMWSFNKLAGSGIIGGCKGTCAPRKRDPYRHACAS